MITFKRYITLIITLALTASIPLAAMKENQQKTTKFQLKQAFLLKATQHDVAYVKENIKIMPIETVQIALESLTGQEESETYKFIANYLDQQPKIEKKRKRKTSKETPEETKKRKINEEAFLKAAKNGELLFVIRNQKQISEEILEEALMIKPLLNQIQQILTSELNDRKKTKKEDNTQETTDEQQEELECPICVSELLESECISLPCDKKSHNFHKECLHAVALECKKNLKTTFPCPCCRKEYNMTTILSENEIKKMERLGTLIQDASTGNIEAAKEILNNHELVTNDDLCIVFKNAAENNKGSIIKLFLNNMDVINKIGFSIINEVFIEAYNDALNTGPINLCCEFLCNDYIINRVSLNDNSLKKMFVAIVKNDLTTFKKYLSQMDFTTEDNEKLSRIIFYLIGFAEALNISHDCLKNKDYYDSNDVGDDQFYGIFVGAAENGYVSIVQEFFKTEENRNILMETDEEDFGETFKNAVKNNGLPILQEFFKKENREILNYIKEDYLEKTFKNAAKNKNLPIIQEFFKPENRDILKKIDIYYLEMAFKNAAENKDLPLFQEFFKKENKDVLNKINNNQFEKNFKDTFKNGILSDCSNVFFIPAAQRGMISIIEIFFEKGQRDILNSIEKTDLGTAFHDAGQNGHLVIIQEFFKPKNRDILKNIDKIDLGRTLHRATENENTDISLEFFKKENKDILKNIDKNDLVKTLHCAIEKKLGIIIEEYLKKENRDILKNMDIYHLASFFRSSVEKGPLCIAQEFFKKENRDILNNISNNDLGFIFRTAAENGTLCIIQKFFEAENSDILEKIVKDWPKFALAKTAENGHLDIVQAFLNNTIVMSYISQEDLKNARENAKTKEIKEAISKHIKNK